MPGAQRWSALSLLSTGVTSASACRGGSGSPGGRPTTPRPACLLRQNPTAPTLAANFECTIPRAVVKGGNLAGGSVYPGHAMLYGHGLLGNADEVTDSSSRDMGNEHDFVMCGTNWLGLSEHDVATDAGILERHLQVPDACPTAASRGCSTSSTWAG